VEVHADAPVRKRHPFGLARDAITEHLSYYCAISLLPAKIPSTAAS